MSRHSRVYITCEDDKARCVCASCYWSGRASDLHDADSAELTAGDVSPAGRCPECDSLAYIAGEKAWRIQNSKWLLDTLTALTHEAHKLLLVPGAAVLVPTISDARRLLAQASGYRAFPYEDLARRGQFGFAAPGEAVNPTPLPSQKADSWPTLEDALNAAYSHMTKGAA